MIDKKYYEMIFKRKSFRRFDNTLTLTKDDIDDIHKRINDLVPLVDNIAVKYLLVPREQTSCKRGEFCLLVYSEEKENYLMNIGYLFEQLDLFLASKDIGVCWYGMGKTQKPEYQGLKFIIMLAIGKAHPSEFRKDYTKCKRKEAWEFWSGGLPGQEILVEGQSDKTDEAYDKTLPDASVQTIAEIIKYAPSACNTQPWRVIFKNNVLKIYQTTKIKSIMPKDKVPFYNSIDMGIFLYFLELTLLHNNVSFQRLLCKDQDEVELIPIALYNCIN